MLAHHICRPVKYALALCLLAALAAPLALRTAVGAEEKKGEALADRMGIVNDNYKSLRRQARTKAFDAESIKLIEQMVLESVKAMHMEPPMAAKVPADKKEQFLLDYRKSMANMLNELLKLEITILEKKNDAAATMIENLSNIKKEGHDKFVEE